MVYLDSGDRLLVIAGCCALILLCLLIMACKLSPYCWCHECCPFRAKFEPMKEKYDVIEPQVNKSQLTTADVQVDVEKLKITRMEAYRPRYMYEPASPASQAGERRSMSLTAKDSYYQRRMLAAGVSQYSSDESETSCTAPRPRAATATATAMLNKGKTEKGRRWSFMEQMSEGAGNSSDDPSDSALLDLVRGELFISLNFSPSADKLNVFVDKVANLSGRMKRRGKVAVKVQCLCAKTPMERIVTLFRRLQLSSEELQNDLTHEAYTRTRDPTNSTTFEEVIEIPIRKSDKEKYCLRFICLAFDKMSKEIPLCESLVLLQDEECEPGTMLIKPLTSPQKEEKGRLQFSIAYLPTSQKLSVTGIVISGLKLSESDDNNSVVFIKLALQRRGVHSKKRVQSHKAGTDIKWKDTVNFDLPREHVNEVSMILSVKQLVTYPSELGEHTNELSLGKIVVGTSSGSPRAQVQWKEMTQNPRQSVTNWHTLF